MLLKRKKAKLKWCLENSGVFTSTSIHASQKFKYLKDLKFWSHYLWWWKWFQSWKLWVQKGHAFSLRRNEHSPVWNIFDTTFKHFPWWPVHLVRAIPSLEFLPRNCDGIAQNRFDLLCRRRSQGSNSIVQNAGDMNSWQKKLAFITLPDTSQRVYPSTFRFYVDF